MRLLAVVAIVILALSLADARNPRRMQRRDHRAMMARRLMNNRGVGSTPMSMKRFPYKAAERRARVNATADGKNATFFGKNDTVPVKNATFYGKNDTVDGGRGKSTDGGDKIDKALNEMSGPMYKLYKSLLALGTLKEMCTEDWAAKDKRDEDINEDYIEYIDEAADIAEELQPKVDKIADGYFQLKCDYDLFCSNLALLQDFLSFYDDMEEDLGDLKEADMFCHGYSYEQI